MLVKEPPALEVSGVGRGVAINKVLVAYDFSAFAERALQYAVVLARKHRAAVLIAHVEAPSELTAEMESGLSAVRRAREQAQRDLEAVVQSIREQQVAVSAVCRVGPATDVLIELAADCQADLMLMGAYGHRHLDTQRLGSTAEYLLRCLPCPTLTFGPQSAFVPEDSVPHRYIVYASSVPNRLGRAARFAETFARAWGATVEIIHVIDNKSTRYDSRRNAEMDVKGAALAQRFKETGIEARWHLWIGSPADKLVERARELAAGMIIFGIEHHTSDPSTYGVVSSTIQGAICPVLTVPGVA